ncbi:hypothetical protein CsSME_00035945 [Camellia sinensis var. sinensis]
MDFFLSHINTAIAGVLSIFLVLCYFLWISKRAAKNSTAPEASGAWPIIGHLHLLGGSELPHITLGAMADKQGPVFTIRLGLKLALVVSNWETAKECFTTNDIAVSSRPKFAAAKHLGYNYAMLSFSPYGPYWREIRKIASLELLGNRRVELLKNVRVSETETSMKVLHKLWREKKSSSGHVLVDMKHWFSDLALNVAVRMVAGKRYFGCEEEKEARQCQKVFRNFFHFLGLFLVSDSIPFLGWFDLGGHVKAMKQTAKEMESIVAGWLEEHRHKRDSGEAKGVQDFMAVMLSTLQGSDFAGYDVDTINKATCLNLIAGGGDTVATMLTWALSLLMNNRHVLKIVQEELDIHVSKERQVDESDISKLVYLQAVIKETLRLYPAAPLSGPREFTQDCTIGGYHVYKGTRLILNTWKLQRDPNIWSEPCEFKPERFLTTHKDVDVNGQHFELIPFGAGRRVCPGIAFGIQMLHLVLARLLNGFEILPASNALVDMSESAGLTNMKATPLEVLVKPRLSHNL